MKKTASPTDNDVIEALRVLASYGPDQVLEGEDLSEYMNMIRRSFLFLSGVRPDAVLLPLEELIEEGFKRSAAARPTTAELWPLAYHYIAETKDADFNEAVRAHLFPFFKNGCLRSVVHVYWMTLARERDLDVEEHL